MFVHGPPPGATCASPSFSSRAAPFGWCYCRASVSESWGECGAPPPPPPPPLPWGAMFGCQPAPPSSADGASAGPTALRLRVWTWDPLGLLGDSLSLDAAHDAVTGLVSSWVGSSAVLVAPVAAAEVVVDRAAWASNATRAPGIPASPAFLAPWTFPPPAARLSAQALLSLSPHSPSPDALRVSLNEATVVISALPRFACAAPDAATQAVVALLNSTDAARALADALLDALLPVGRGTGYRGGRNLKIGWNFAQNLGALAGADAGGAPACGAHPKTVTSLSGYDVRALPAAWPGNSAGEGIAVIDADACTAVQDTGLACRDATFIVDGRLYHLIGTLEELNMAPAGF
jgi:hypothetical protein